MIQMKICILLVLAIGLTTFSNCAETNRVFKHTPEIYRSHAGYEFSIEGDVVAARGGDCRFSMLDEVLHQNDRASNQGYEVRSRMKLRLPNPGHCSRVYMEQVSLTSNTFISSAIPSIVLGEIECSKGLCMQVITVDASPLACPRDRAQMSDVRTGKIEFNFVLSGEGCGPAQAQRPRRLTQASARITYEVNALGLEQSARDAEAKKQAKRDVTPPRRTNAKRDLPTSCTIDNDCLADGYTCLISATCNNTVCENPVLDQSVCDAKTWECATYLCDVVDSDPDKLDADGCSVDYADAGTTCPLPTNLADLPISNMGGLGQCDGYGGCILMPLDEDILDDDDDNDATDDVFGASGTSSDSSTDSDDAPDDDGEITRFEDLKHHFNWILGVRNGRIVVEEDSDASQNLPVLSRFHTADSRWVTEPWAIGDDDTASPGQMQIYARLVDDEEDDDDMDPLRDGLYDCNIAPLFHPNGTEVPNCGGITSGQKSLNGVFYNTDDDDLVGDGTQFSTRICSPVCYCVEFEYGGKNNSFVKVCTRNFFPGAGTHETKSGWWFSIIVIPVIGFIVVASLAIMYIYAMAGHWRMRMPNIVGGLEAGFRNKWGEGMSMMSDQDGDGTDDTAYVEAGPIEVGATLILDEEE